MPMMGGNATAFAQRPIWSNVAASSCTNLFEGTGSLSAFTFGQQQVASGAHTESVKGLTQGHNH